MAVAAALALGVLAATLWPGGSPGPPAAEQRPGDRDPAAPATPSATLAPEPATTTAAPSPVGELTSRRVTIQRRAARPERTGTPVPPPAEVAVPFGLAKKATGRIPPGQGAEHPGKGHAQGRE
ncbi:hypothetical protein ABGB18_31700 [Nonomuraea sp. B12E4]|uniref:hypothetical protein n=1 Tax=Nonomuraea sp. B12E4 TaxID=3153564 RepID=UPI00325D186A